MHRASRLALNGGSKPVVRDPGDVLRWPALTREDDETFRLAHFSGGHGGGDPCIVAKFVRNVREGGATKTCQLPPVTVYWHLERERGALWSASQVAEAGFACPTNVGEPAQRVLAYDFRVMSPTSRFCSPIRSVDSSTEARLRSTSPHAGQNW